MLRNVGVRTKLLGIIAVPMAFLLAVTGALVLQAVSAATQAERVRQLTVASAQLNRLVHGFQAERSATMGYLATRRPQDRVVMKGIRAKVDGGLVQLRATIAHSPVNQVSRDVAEAVALASRQHEGIRAIRAKVDSDRYFESEVQTYYDTVIATDLQLPGLVAESAGSAQLAQELRAYQALSTMIEASAKERDLLGNVLRLDQIGRDDFIALSGYVAQQNSQLDTFRKLASGEQSQRLSAVIAHSDIFGMEEARREAGDLLVGKTVPANAAALWLKASNGRIDALSRFEAQTVQGIADQAGAAASDARRTAALDVLVALLGLGLAVLVTVALARRMVRPLRRLTVAAAQVGEELPNMVARMQTPGEGPGVEIEPIAVESGDEIGKLAEAFNTVNEVTVRVAKEQAALRASIAEMFVNVARRNQVLLGRQLSQIDQMEAREEDPDVLENLFKLDHLATRMRRNAESLLVLAGIDATRRLRSSLPLSDVIRTAVSEIEAFDRVDLSLPQDPEVSGRLALTTAHLLAELLENATHFSNPDTRVVVSAALTGQGVDLTITDYGLGMSEEEIAEANRRIAEPPVAEIAVSQRLGLFVVGRLAQRLGASIVLRRGRSGGTVVTVALPDSVFEGMDRPVASAPPVPVVEPVAEAGAGPVVEPAAEPVLEAASEAAPEEPTEAADVPAETVPVAEHVSDPVSEARAAIAAGADAEDPGAPAALKSEPRRRRIARRRAAAEPIAPASTAASETVEEESALLSVWTSSEREAEERTRSTVVSDAEPVAEPVAQPAAPVVGEPVAQPAAPVAAEPVAPAPQPVPQYVLAPAIDILPGRPMTSRVEARTAPAPRPTPAAAPAAASSLSGVSAPQTRTSAGSAPAPVPAPARPAAPPVQAPAAASLADVVPATPLRSRSAAPAAAPGQPPLPSPAPVTDMERLAVDAQIHSNALSELRGLYEPSYAPQAVTGRPVTEGLARRTPKVAAPEAVPAGTPAAAPNGGARTRNAAEVRGMLSGFRAGVERGRTTPGNAETTVPSTPNS